MMCYLATSAPAVLGFEGLGPFLSEDSAPYSRSILLYLDRLENVVGSAPTYTMLVSADIHLTSSNGTHCLT
jgi:hypothetical protein